MAIKHAEGSINVVDAARMRVQNAFDTGSKVYLSFSSGKDSLCMAHITYSLILNGKIDKSHLVVIFIDEEGLYKSMVDQAYYWHKKFTQIGVKFLWFCLPFKQVSVLDSLSAEESWITWEPGKEDCWMRTPPPFAITYHPYLKYAGQMNYQTFCQELTKDGINMIGVRTSESLMRLKNIAMVNNTKNFFPIYDWKDTDIWRYIRDNNLKFPEAYMDMYASGCGRNEMRLCAFFGEGGTRGLRKIAETDHDLWNKIQKREPNAYMILLYWDSEMFNRQTKKRKKLEDDQEKKDYKYMFEDILYGDTDKYRIGVDTKKRLREWRKLYLTFKNGFTDKTYKRAYEGLIFGDPKARVLRAIYTEAGKNLYTQWREDNNEL